MTNVKNQTPESLEYAVSDKLTFAKAKVLEFLKNKEYPIEKESQEILAKIEHFRQLGEASNKYRTYANKIETFFRNAVFYKGEGKLEKFAIQVAEMNYHINLAECAESRDYGSVAQA